MTFTGLSVGQLGKAMLTPFHLIMGIFMGFIIFFIRKGHFNLQISLLLLIGYIVLANTIIHPGSRITSVIYSVVLSFEYVIMYQLLLRVKKEIVLKAFTIIMFAYLINIFLGFVISSAHLNIGQGIINVFYSEGDGSARPMGFSSEPSYAAFILSITFLAFNHLRGHKVDKIMWQMLIAYLLSTLLMKSAYGFIFVAVNMLDWFLFYFKRMSFNLRIVFLMAGITFLFLMPFALQNSKSESILRLQNVSSIMNDSSLEPKKKLAKLQEEDGSAYARIGPTWLLIEAGGDIEIDWILGAGAGEAGLFFKEFMAGVLVDGDEVEKLDMGLIPAFVFDYGFVGTALLILFFISCTYNLSLPYWICLFLILPNCNINTQLFWYGILVFAYISAYKQMKLAISLPPKYP
jgi:hypothetical protein